MIEQAATESLQTHERWWDAELHRLRGELLGTQGADPADVEGAFRRAMAVAQAQGARSLELRAAISLARLCRAARYDAPAGPALAAVYGWFCEGFATPDLQAAALRTACLSYRLFLSI